MEIFKFNNKTFGKTFILRPLLSPNEPECLDYRVGFNNFTGGWLYHKLIYATVNGEFKIVLISTTISRYLEKFINSFSPKSYKAFEIKVEDYGGYPKLKINVIEHSKFNYSETKDKRERYMNFFKNNNFNLKKAWDKIVKDVGDYTVDIAGDVHKLKDVQLDLKTVFDEYYK